MPWDAIYRQGGKGPHFVKVGAPATRAQKGEGRVIQRRRATPAEEKRLYARIHGHQKSRR